MKAADFDVNCQISNPHIEAMICTGISYRQLLVFRSYSNKVTGETQNAHRYSPFIGKEAWMLQGAFVVNNRKNWLIAGFVAAAVALLMGCLVILSYRAHAILADLSEKADQAIKIGDKVDAAFSGEIAAIVGFQATGEARYIQMYRERGQTIDESLAELERLMPSLGPALQRSFKELKSAIDTWNRDAKIHRIATERLPPDEFRQFVFDRLSVITNSHKTMTEFSDAIVEYESRQRLRLERLGSLFRTLAIIFGPLALLALLLIAHILRRLTAMTSHLENRATEEKVLRQAGVTLAGGLRLEDVLRRTTEAASIAAEADGVFIETVDRGRTEMTCVAAYGARTPVIGLKSPLEGSLVQEVLQTREPQIIDNIDTERNRKYAIGERACSDQHHATMVVPLIAENEGLGAMFLIRPPQRPFTRAELPKVRILADMASVALMRAVRVEEVQKLEARARFLSETSKLMTSSLDYAATLKNVVRRAVETIADWCVVYLVDRHGRIYIAELAHSDPEKHAVVERLRSKHRPRPDGLESVEGVIRTGKAQLVSEVTDELLREHSSDEEHLGLLRQLNLKSSMLVPLILRGEILGVMVFTTSDTRRYYADDLAFAEEIARHAAIAIHNARLYTGCQHAIRSRDDVFRMVAHDLRNPVSNIQVIASVLTKISMPEEERQSMLQKITRSLQRMNRLIEDLLTVGRMEEGLAIPLKIDRVEPEVIIDQACEAIAFQVRARSIELRCNKPDALPPVKADRDRIFQALVNLLDNAIKFTPEGGNITLSCEVSAGEMQFAVKDTGPGINPTDLARMFDAFWQAKTSANFGSGLGLAIVKGIVEEHKGRIWAESTPGVGTTVFFTLPLADIGEMPPRKAA
jgi:signal transduction histidine kinase